jgi:parallel beta-helix repeat protein
VRKVYRVNNKAFETTVSVALLNGMLTFAFNIQTVGATGTIYIRGDGSVCSSEAPVPNAGNIYRFTSNINDLIIVERDNIVINGAGYTLQDVGSGTGINLTSRSNVTVQNTKATKFYYGVYLESSSNISLSGNADSDNTYGIMLDVSTNNILVGNHASNNDLDGIYVVYSDNNILYGNTVSNNRCGMVLSESYNNRIFHNNFVSNALNQTYLFQSVNDVWDDGYPSGGN